MPTFSGPLTLPKRVSEIVFAAADLAVDDHDRFRAVIARVDGFRDQRGVARQALVAAFRRESGRLVAQQHDDFALYVDAGVIVVAEFVGARRRIPRRPQARARLAGGGKAEGTKSSLSFSSSFLAPICSIT